MKIFCYHVICPLIHCWRSLLLGFGLKCSEENWPMYSLPRLTLVQECKPIKEVLDNRAWIRIWYDCFLFVCLFYSFYDQSAKFYFLTLIFSTLCVVHDLIFQRKLSRRRLPITFVNFVSHASAQALRPITFTLRFRTTRHPVSIHLLWKSKSSL